MTYSVDITVSNLNRGTIECRKSVVVDRGDWATAFLVALQAVVDELPALPDVKRKALLDRMHDIVSEAMPDYGRRPDR